MPEPIGVPAGVDPTQPSPARLYDYYLGGQNNFEADRELAEKLRVRMPELEDASWGNRGFLQRVVRRLAAGHGISQFLDIGAGLPTRSNTHQVAQRIMPRARVVYVDNDPMVLVHARALLTSAPQGATAYIDADVNDPDAIIAEARRTLDFTQPVAITMLGVLNFIVDDDEAQAVLRRLVHAVPPGSYLVISHPTSELTDEAATRALDLWNSSGAAPMCLRTAAQLTRFFDGLELLDPGVVSCVRWRPDVSEEAAVVKDVMHFGGVARIG